MNFNMHSSVDKTGSVLDFLITRNPSKLVDDISSQFLHQYYKNFLLLMSEIHRTGVTFTKKCS